MSSETSTNLAQLWAHGSPPRTASSPLAGRQPRTLPRAPEGCLPVSSTAAGPVRRGQERPRGQPGARRQVAGAAPPPGSAAHLGGERRLPGCSPARGALPILKGSGHRSGPGGSGVLGDARPGEGGREAGGEEPVRHPSALQVRWPRRLRSGPGGSSVAPPSRERAEGEGRGRRRRVGRGEERWVGAEGGGATRGGGGEAAQCRSGPERAGGAPRGLASFPGQLRLGFGGCAPGLDRLLPRWASEREGEPEVRGAPRRWRRGPSEAAIPPGLPAGLQVGPRVSGPDPQPVPFFLFCKLRSSPKLRLGRHDRPHGARRPGGLGARFAPVFPPSTPQPKAGVGELGGPGREERRQ